MRRFVRAVLSAAWLGLLIGGCGGGSASNDTEQPPQAAPLVTPGTWVVLGSSTATGVGATAGHSWPERLAAAMVPRQVVLQNLARAGTLTPQALPTSAPAPAPRPAPDPTLNIDRALGFAPRLVLLAFPTNDTVAGYSADETVANLRSLRSTAAAAGAASLVLGVQPRNALTPTQRATLAEVERQLAALAGDCHVALYAALADSDDRIAAAYSAGDGIHLNDAGHAVVHARVQAVLDSGRCVRLGT